MGLQLDWDKDRTKETSDIYIKVKRNIVEEGDKDKDKDKDNYMGSSWR